MNASSSAAGTNVAAAVVAAVLVIVCFRFKNLLLSAKMTNLN